MQIFLEFFLFMSSLCKMLISILNTVACYSNLLSIDFKIIILLAGFKKTGDHFHLNSNCIHSFILQYIDCGYHFYIHAINKESAV